MKSPEDSSIRQRSFPKSPWNKDLSLCLVSPIKCNKTPKYQYVNYRHCFKPQPFKLRPTFIFIEPRRDRNRKFTGISSHPSFRANVHFAFANNVETCAEIITKPGRQERGAVSESRYNIVVSVVELTKIKKSCETCGLTKEETHKYCLNCGIMVWWFTKFQFISKFIWVRIFFVRRFSLAGFYKD